MIETLLNILHKQRINYVKTRGDLPETCILSPVLSPEINQAVNDFIAISRTREGLKIFGMKIMFSYDLDPDQFIITKDTPQKLEYETN